MRTTTIRLALPFVLAGLLAALAGCDTGPGDSLYDPDRESAPDPVIASVSPPGSALAGIDIVTISGENFSSEPSENLVYFDAARAEVIEASATQLRVRPPNLPRPELTLRVVVMGAENFASVPYRLDAAAERFAELPATDEPYALATDEEGNVYVSLFSEGVSAGVKRFSPDGERADYFPPISAPWRDLAIGPDGELYGVRRVGAVFQLPEGGPASVWGVASSPNEPLGAIVFDAQGALWAGSRNGNLFRFEPDGSSFERFEIGGTIEDLAIFEGMLYVAVTRGGEGSVSNVERYPISAAGELGEGEVYAPVSDLFGVSALALAFAADGSLLVGTSEGDDNDTALVLVGPEGSAEVFYPGILRPPVLALAWGPGTSVYALGRVVASDQSNGRTFPDLVRIETRRSGA